MSIEPIDSMDAELMPTKAEANASVERAIDHAEGFWSEIQWQAEHKAWESLGYASFDELWERRYSSLGVRISREERPQLVSTLRAIGQTQQGIADKLGVNQASVSRDLNMQTHNDQPTTITNSRGQERPGSYQRSSSTGLAEQNLRDAASIMDADGLESHFVDTTTGEIHDGPAPAKVTGMDGKQYTRPAPADAPKPRRKPLAEQAQEAQWGLVAAIERMERIIADERFAANKEVVTPHMRSHLTNAIESCQGLLDRIDN